MSLRDMLKMQRIQQCTSHLSFFRHRQARLMTGRLLCLFWLHQDGREFWGDLKKKKQPSQTLPRNNLFKWIGLFSCWSALLIVFERIKANHKLLSAAGKNGFTCQLINKMNSISKTYLGFSQSTLHPLELMRVSSISVRAALKSGLLNLVNTAGTFFCWS